MAVQLVDTIDADTNSETPEKNVFLSASTVSTENGTTSDTHAQPGAGGTVDRAGDTGDEACDPPPEAAAPGFSIDADGNLEVVS